ncbi:beta-glucosidase 13-like [Pyrus ussuriensis x Pyrus communis]|uniref:Beta-glucosidase 13-like n=1 Tax=Pyrus ussuriensis x Pyrus communis TaxID=2448454 RepID=A0A5N5GSU6_9ROSA|nr:beta-glucosidase 13-like [Pyrus ussuriensis x Pyrus communis]
MPDEVRNKVGGSKFPKIDVFSDVYVRPGDELNESFHLHPETPLKSMDPPEDAGFQILTETLDQTLRQRLGAYCPSSRNLEPLHHCSQRVR